MNKRYYQISGFLGAVCLVCALSFFIVKRTFSVYALLNALLGAGLFSFFLYNNLKDMVKALKAVSEKGPKNTIISTLLILGLVLLVNLFANLFYHGFDLTGDKVSSISDNSQKVIKWIKNPIEILVFSTRDGKDYEQYLLDSYSFYNRKITYRFIDPEMNPQLAHKFGIDKTGQSVVRCKDGFIKIENVVEQSITNSILRITQSVKNSVYFMYGHDENVLDDLKSNQGYGLLWKELLFENYSVYKLKLEPPNYYIPGNCTVLVVAGPRKMYTEFEIKAIKEYLDNSGRAIFLLDPNVKTGLEKLVEEWGIRCDDNCLVDAVFPSLVERAVAKLQGRKLSIKPVLQVLVNEFPENEITKDLKDNSIIISVAKSLSRVEFEQPIFNLVVKSLGKSTNKGWAEADLDGLFRRESAGMNSEEKRGPFDVAMLSIRGTSESNNSIIVIGDSDFVNNEYIHQLYNRDFFMNCLAYLSSQVSLISVRPRHLFASRLDYNPETMILIFTISVLLFPQILLMAGIAIWWLRR
ncbi:MAG: GldG family protein [Candidatus Firestonebacteria bacterium]